MSRHILHVDFDFDFELICIISSLRDYRLCHYISRVLHFDFIRRNDLEVTNERKRSHTLFSLFAFDDQINFLQYFFIGNKCAGAHLIPELKQVDYFLMMRGDAAGINKLDVMQQLKNLGCIQAVFDTDPRSLKSKNNFIFE